MDLICSDRAQNGLALSGPIAGGTVQAAASVDKVLSALQSFSSDRSVKTPTFAFPALQPGGARTSEIFDIKTLNMDLICSDRAQNGLALSGPIAGGTVKAAASVDKVLIMTLTAAGKVAFFARRLNWSCKKRPARVDLRVRGGRTITSACHIDLRSSPRAPGVDRGVLAGEALKREILDLGELP